MPRELRELPVERILCRPQPRERFDDDALAGLAQSMCEEGLLQPILVGPGTDRWPLIDGERRLRAAKQLGWPTIPALIESSEAGEDSTLLRQLIANCQREDLTPIELARSIEQLMAASGSPAADIAARLGLSPARVSKHLALLVLPPEIQAKVHTGEIAASTAYHIAREANPRAQAELAERAIGGKLTREEVAIATRTGSSRAKRSRPSVHARRRRFAVVSLGDQASLRIMGESFTASDLLAALQPLVSRLTELGAMVVKTADAPSSLRGSAAGVGRDVVTRIPRRNRR